MSWSYTSACLLAYVGVSWGDLDDDDDDDDNDDYDGDNNRSMQLET